MKDVHAVLSVLGPGLGHPSNTPLAHGYALIIEVMKKHDVKRLIALGTASITDEHDKFSLLFTLLINVVATFAHNAYKDIVAVGDTIRGQGDELDWTIVRVGLLTHSEKKDVVAGYVGMKGTLYIDSLTIHYVFWIQVERNLTTACHKYLKCIAISGSRCHATPIFGPIRGYNLIHSNMSSSAAQFSSLLHAITKLDDWC
ncbi:hypothetical protein A0H81_00356 [Grifola frondosa]|uniref:NAD(P)-binding domain-containing protein n=1 Tax=Grifola frondosa TaxID=5627 RepID=A0A1C7MSK8_GRIFR|nr:hypothetical protein A0H81_00356 [Grifola frondosa]